MQDPKNVVGAIIRDRRIQKRMTQQELGRKVGLNSRTISNVERGYSPITRKTAHALSGFIGCTPEELLEGTFHRVVQRKRKEHAPRQPKVEKTGTKPVIDLFAGASEAAPVPDPEVVEPDPARPSGIVVFRPKVKPATAVLLTRDTVMDVMALAGADTAIIAVDRDKNRFMMTMEVPGHDDVTIRGGDQYLARFSGGTLSVISKDSFEREYEVANA